MSSISNKTILKVRHALMLFALFVISTSSFAQQQMIIGNCDTNNEGELVYVGQNTGVGFATQFSQFKMGAYKGKTLKSISIYVYGYNVEGRVFVATDLKSTTTPLAEQKFQNLMPGWNEIVFDHPWTITRTKIYIGYQFDKTGDIVIAKGVSLLPGTEYFNDGSGWSALSSGCGMFYATVEGDNLPANEVALGKISMPGIATTGAGFKPKAEIVNLGNSNVTSIDISYHVNGDTDIRTTTVTELNIAKRTIKTITLPALTLSPDGDYNVAVEVSKVNGEDDAAPIDNTSATSLVYVRSGLPKRTVLVETFSTERCTGCPTGHAIINNVIEGKENVIEIGHHAGFYTDQFTIPASTAYEWFYKTPDYTTSYAPAVMFDRTNMRTIHGSQYAMDVPLFEPNPSRVNTAYDTQSVSSGLATIDIKPTFNSSTRQLSIDIDAEAVVLMANQKKPVLNVFILEDKLTTNKQEGTEDGVFTHRHTARACLTPIWGEEIDTRTRKISKSYTYDIPTTWKIQNCEVVAFVSNYDSTNNNNCQVLNAAKGEITFTDGIETIGASKELVSREYYTPAGLRLQQPHGTCLVIERYADGSVKKAIR